MDSKISRRTFLKGGMGGVALISLGSVMPAVFVRAMFSPTSSAYAAQGRVVVILQQAGGNDGLNTLVPYANPAYFDARGDLAVDPEEVLTLDERVGLHPAMTGMKTLWDEGRLAVVEGVGYPNPDRSHFRSMEIWHTANPEGVSYDGWLGKYLTATTEENNSLWRAMAVGSSLSPSFAGGPYVPAVESVEAYQLKTDSRYPADHDNKLQAWTSLYAQAAAEPGYLPFVGATGTQAFESSVELQQITSSYDPAVEYPQGPLGEALALCAQMIDSDLGTGICYVTTGGFDTHAQQSNQHAQLLGGVSDAVLAFLQDIDAHGHGQEVVLMTWSEFGRRVKANASSGTDHGTAGPMFIAGGPVNGGLHGEPPSISALDDNGDLIFTTDFRSVYATVLEGWLETDSKDVLAGTFPTLPVF
ncbi:MAG: DUF1501 domain-containing protein [Dehalococcoidia bacterium]